VFAGVAANRSISDTLTRNLSTPYHHAFAVGLALQYILFGRFNPSQPVTFALLA